MNRSARKVETIIIAFITIGFICWSAVFIYKSSFIAIDGKRYFCLFDDAMISMRYAWNFAHGIGLVWNQGEYTQGFTNLLMTLLMSLSTWIFDKSAAALFIQILGVGFVLASAFVSLKIVEFVDSSEFHNRYPYVRVVTFVCVLLYYPLAYWSIMGMETGLLTILLLMSIFYTLVYTKTKNLNHLLIVSGCLGLTYLTRTDSLIFAMIIWAYIIWQTWNSSTKSRKNIFIAISIYSFFIIGLFVFQYLYYGEFLPNTYTLKLTGMSLMSRLINGVGFITPFLKICAFILVFSSVGLMLYFTKQKAFLFLIAISAIGYQIYVGGDPWAYWRIMSPIMPLLILLFISSINRIVLALFDTVTFRINHQRSPTIYDKPIAQTIVVLLVMVGMVLANRGFLPEMSFKVRPYQADSNQFNINTALVLNQLTTSDASIGVFWAGSIPYYAIDKRAIDFLGKSDKYIARLPPDVTGKISWNGMKSVPGHNKYDLTYSIMTLQPTYVQRLIWGAQDLTEWGESRYVKVETMGVSLLLLKDSPSVLWEKVKALSLPEPEPHPPNAPAP